MRVIIAPKISTSDEATKEILEGGFTERKIFYAIQIIAAENWDDLNTSLLAGGIQCINLLQSQGHNLPFVKEVPDEALK